MIKSVQQLEAEEKERAAKEKALRKKREQENDLRLREHHARLTETYIEHTIPTLIEKNMNARRFKFPSGHNYAGEPQTFFAPNTDEAKLILSELKSGGYTANIESVELPNFTYEFYGDGEYMTVNVPGTYTVHYLNVSW